MLTLALLLHILQKKLQKKKLQVNYVPYLSKMIALSFLSAIVIKLLERSRLKYSLVQSLLSVEPQKLVFDSAEAQLSLSDFCRFCSTESGVRQKLATKFVFNSKALYWK